MELGYHWVSNLHSWRLKCKEYQSARMNAVFRSEWSLRFWIQTVWKSWCGSSGSDINSDKSIAKQQAADISIGNRTPCIYFTHLNNIKNLEVHKSSVMWEKQTSSEGNCWIPLLRLFRKKRVDRNNLSSLTTSYNIFACIGQLAFIFGILDVMQSIHGMCS